MIVNGDARLPETFAKLGGSSRADVLITDPPYCLLERRRKGGDLRDPKKRSKLDGEDTVPRYESVKQYKQFTQEWLSTCVQHGLKDDAVLCIWTNALGKRPIVDVAQSLGYELRGEYLWAKRTSAGAPSATSTKNEVLLRVYESALVLTKRGDQHSAEKLALQSGDASLPWSVITGYHEEDSEDRHDHPCHKPFAALEPLLRAWTKPGDTVLDCFAGSGGILQATVRIRDRHVVGIELLPEWATKANLAVKEEVAVLAKVKS
jgi:site-specific DNA-methyltransferase (adenine-specific)